MELQPQEIWQQALNEIRGRIHQQSFETWFKPTRAVSLVDETLKIEVSRPFLIDFLAENYLPLMQNAVEAIVQRPLKIVLACSQGKAQWAPSRRRSPTRSPGSTVDESQLHERYTFLSFVVGKGNEFAHAAALAVAEAPAKVYNPLFIYGRAGLGKTHLTQAIGHFVKRERSKSRVYYTPAESFMNEMIYAIQHRRTLEFKNKYRSMDLLLLDDVHFLAAKESLQEEIFHTFNSLYDAHKQIVMTSDRPPKEIPNLEERLVSRFQSGLVADIQPPDLETRIAILRKKAEGEGCAVPNEVLFFVAERVTSNIRDLEGCLTRVVALSSLSGQEITLQMAEDALRHILPATAKRIGIKEIQQAVAEFYSIPLEGMVSHRRTKELAFPRQMAMYVCRQKTTASLSEIGSQFGGKDHTTVLHALDKIQRLLEGNGETKAVLSQILSLLDQR